MEADFHKNRFSAHFNHLTYLGMWSADMLTTATSKKLYLAYCLIPHGLLATAISLQMVDLYTVMGNLRKVTFNFCTSSIVIGYTMKMMMLYDRKDCLNELRLNLWKDSLRLKSEEDVALLDDAYGHLKTIRHWFYNSCVCILPVMLVSSYFSYIWGPRELPFAGYLPMPDPLDDSIYVPALLFEAVCAFYVIFVAIEAELSMFSVVLQVDAYYGILIKNIEKVNGIYADLEDDTEQEEGRRQQQQQQQQEGKKDPTRGDLFKREVNVYLRKASANKMLKVAVLRHLKLIEYAEKFEYIFSRCMFLHAVAGSLLIIMNGIELSLYINEMSIKLCFQVGYITMVTIDLLFICYYLSRLSVQCSNVANAAYSTFWYKMDPDTRRKLLVIIMRSRRPPRITGGKFFLMDLNTFLHILSNIYSWVMLMRRVISK